jgi:murein L,D-transpeptidase YcbB/YkuD
MSTMNRSWLARAALHIAAAGALAAFTGAHAQPVDELLRSRVEQLRDGGELEAAGVPIAAKTLIPKLYEAREFMPAWHSVAQIDSLLEVVEGSFLEGLNPADYHVEQVRAARRAFEHVDTLPAGERADFDLMLTDSVIRLGYHLRFGKVDPVALDSDWNFSRKLVDQDPVETIQAAIDAPSMREFAERVIPRNSLYLRLKQALADYRAIAAKGGWGAIAPGPALKAGMNDPRVPALRARLAATGDFAASVPPAGVEAPTFDAPLAAALERFQARHGLAADGVLGPATVSALNVPVEARIAQIRANLERGRWVLGDLKSDFIVVNIAGFELYEMRGGEIVERMRVQVGQPYRKTPVFKAKLTYLVFNPTWTVPPTVFIHDILPELKRNPDYLATRNIDLFDDDGALVDPHTVDWRSRRSFPYRLVQRPGPTNALGRVKFMYPNEHFVYLHDTPSRNLFERDNRAFSSGCIRVEHPLDLAATLLGPKWDRARVEAAISSGRTETVFLDKPITLMLLYWTTEVDANGRVSFWPDVYSRDAAVIRELDAPFEASDAL